MSTREACTKGQQIKAKFVGVQEKINKEKPNLHGFKGAHKTKHKHTQT